MPIETTYNSLGQRNLIAPLLVYFAGKVRKNNDYRSLIFMDDRIMSTTIGTELPVYQGHKFSDVGTVKYGGPTALSCDHGCWHRAQNSHGIVNPFDPFKDFTPDHLSIHPGFVFPDDINDEYGCPTGSSGLSRSQAMQRCTFQILQSHALYAYIDSRDCYGTLAEIGFAHAAGIPIHIVFSEDFEIKKKANDYGQAMYEHDDFWFIKEMAQTVRTGKPWAALKEVAFDKQPDLKRTRRHHIKAKTRVDVLVRDKYTCQMCGAKSKDGAVLEIDHIHPVSLGGSNELSNLQVLCRECNSGKSNRIIPMP